jgi:hypothetical protein
MMKDGALALTSTPVLPQRVRTKVNTSYSASCPRGLFNGYPTWTPYEKKSLPIFYKETIARILALDLFRNLIETQTLGSGTTCYSDHLPGIKCTLLSNKGKLSTWKLHETSDLTSIVITLYKSGPTMAIADPLSRLSRQEHRVDNLDLPLLLEMLLTELPEEIRKLVSTPHSVVAVSMHVL